MTLPVLMSTQIRPQWVSVTILSLNNLKSDLPALDYNRFTHFIDEMMTTDQHHLQ